MLLLGIASLRSPRRERPSDRGLGAWRNDNRLYHRKNKRTDTFTARKGGYVGHETNIGCPRPKTKNHVINIYNIIQSSWLHWFPKEIITLGKFNSEIL